MARPRRWTDEQLRSAVAASSTWSEVMDRLGLVRGGGSLTAVRRRVIYLGVPIPPPLRRVRSDEWTADPATIPTSRSPVEPGRRRWTDAQLTTAVREASSIAGVIRALGLQIAGPSTPP